MPTTHTLVIGAGQAGLAMSRCLTDAGIDHVVLERGRIAERWRSERWDSLRLLTPNWASRLPGWSYWGAHPDGYMTAAELAAYLDGLRRFVRRPGRGRTATSRGCRHDDNGFAVRTTDDVVARPQRRHGHRLVRPAARARRSPTGSIRRSPRSRRAPTANPDQLPDGRVLVVGAVGDRGADRRRARPRRPRRRARRRPPQPRAAPLPRDGHLVVARPDRHVRHDHRRGRATRPRPATKAPSSSSAATTTATSTSPRSQRARRPPHRPAHRRRRDRPRRSPTTSATPPPPPTSVSRRLLARIDDHIDATGLDREVLSADTPARLPRDRTDHAARRPARRHRARSCGPLATAAPTRGCGSRSSTPHGEIVQRRGVTPVAGLYVVGQRFQHRRDSNFIDGVRHDAVVRRPPHRRPSQPPRHRAVAESRGRAMTEPTLPLTTSSSSAPEPPAPPPPCSSPAPVSTCSSSTAAATGPTRCRPTR